MKTGTSEYTPVVAKVNREPTEEQIAASLAREDLAIFISLVSRTDDGKAALPPRHLLDLVIPAIEDDSLGHTLIIAPPGSAKTNTMIGAAAWWLGRDPEQHVAYFCDNATRATERSLAVRSLIDESPAYRAIFPEAVPNPKRGWAGDSWYLERRNIADKNASFLSAGMDSSVLGARIDRAVLDDVWNQKIADSATEREKALTTLNKVLMTRMHPKRGRIVGICTRWGEDDFAQWAMDAGFHTIHIPAINEQGESYWQDYFPISRLRCENDQHSEGQCCIYRMIGSSAFTQQYMGEVTNADSAIFKPNWWAYYDGELEQWDRGVIVIDTAGWDAGSKTSDFAALSAWAKVGDDYYVLDVVEDRMSFPEVERAAMTMKLNWQLPILVEDVPWARPLIQALQKETAGVIPWKVQGRSKFNRAQSVSPIVEAGRVFLPRKAPWTARWVQQHAMFPHGRNDDLVDNTSMALGYLDRNAGRVRRNLKGAMPFTRDWSRLSA